MLELSGLIKHRGNHIAQRKKSHRRRHNEKRDSLQSSVQSLPQYLGDFSVLPMARDIAGSSAADTDMPNKLTGNV